RHPMHPPAKTFQSLLVWQKAHAFVLTVYKTTETFPKHELYGLTSQLRRAAVSIPANIAEGFRKRSLADKSRFYNISQGSLEECRYYLILAQDLDYAETHPLQIQLDEVARLLHGYIASLSKTRILSPTTQS
ncbi:MAG TPA: four helix bundle protein, partial [Opitutales bacterium]|nr:four helix bundle protein [Opitutales bacterium]